jgi:ADP-L-glycero-D-manno-heptose 6-epimerase
MNMSADSERQPVATTRPENGGPYTIVTGAAGFIASRLARHLNALGERRLILVDAFGRADKQPNLRDVDFAYKVDRDILFAWLQAEGPPVARFYHLGARTDTTEFDYRVHERLNVEYSKAAWAYCARHAVPLVYASSAATYGDGSLGYSDDHTLPDRLQPLNPYGVSKNEFDRWALRQTEAPPHWYGLKFFNVYGPGEAHKGRMASVVFHAFRQIRACGHVELFRSHRPGFRDGWQLRDFIHVDDVVAVCHWLAGHRPASGLHNLGTGQARSFEDLAKATFAGMGIPPDIRYIDMPEDIRDKYQYFTQADMHKLRAAGYESPFRTLEEGVADYVRHHLVPTAGATP